MNKYQEQQQQLPFVVGVDATTTNTNANITRPLVMGGDIDQHTGNSSNSSSNSNISEHHNHNQHNSSTLDTSMSSDTSSSPPSVKPTTTTTSTTTTTTITTPHKSPPPPTLKSNPTKKPSLFINTNFSQPSPSPSPHQQPDQLDQHHHHPTSSSDKSKHNNSNNNNNNVQTPHLVPSLVDKLNSINITHGKVVVPPTPTSSAHVIGHSTTTQTSPGSIKGLYKDPSTSSMMMMLSGVSGSSATGIGANRVGATTPPVSALMTPKKFDTILKADLNLPNLNMENPYAKQQQQQHHQQQLQQQQQYHNAQMTHYRKIRAHGVLSKIFGADSSQYMGTGPAIGSTPKLGASVYSGYSPFLDFSDEEGDEDDEDDNGNGSNDGNYVGDIDIDKFSDGTFSSAISPNESPKSTPTSPTYPPGLLSNVSASMISWVSGESPTRKLAATRTTISSSYAEQLTAKLVAPTQGSLPTMQQTNSSINNSSGIINNNNSVNNNNNSNNIGNANTTTSTTTTSSSSSSGSDRSIKDNSRDGSNRRPTKLLIQKFLSKSTGGSGGGSNTALGNSHPPISKYTEPPSAPYILPQSSKESLSTLMKDKIGYDLFRTFCEKEHSLSNLEFLEDVEHLQSMTTTAALPNEALDEAKRIYNKYLQVGAADELAVDSDLVAQVQARLSNCSGNSRQQLKTSSGSLAVELSAAALANEDTTLDRTLFDKIYRVIKEDVTLDSFKRFCHAYNHSTSSGALAINGSRSVSPPTTPSLMSESPPLDSADQVPLSLNNSPRNHHHSQLPHHQQITSLSPRGQSERQTTSNSNSSSPVHTSHHHHPREPHHHPSSSSSLPALGVSLLTSPPLSPRISMIKPLFLKQTQSLPSSENSSPLLQTQSIIDDMQQYGVAFGFKRGCCKAPCDCLAYKSQGLNGGACLNCGHYPASHKNLGKANASPLIYPNSFDLASNDLPESVTEVFNEMNKLDLSLVHKDGSMDVSGIDYSNYNITDNNIDYASDLDISQQPSDLSSVISGVSGTTQRTQVPNRIDHRLFSNFSNWIIDGDDLVFMEKLGQGASAKVYKADWRNQEVAVKILKKTPEQQKLQDFLKELEIMSSLRSPHVVYFYGIVLQPRISMIMEYCSNLSLHHLMHTSMDFSWDWVIKFSTEMVKGIKCLHNWKPVIVHRDLKSLNLLVTDHWTIKVADFGLSRFQTGKTTLRKTRGTYAYCAPEVHFGDSTVKGDIFSIGIIIWEMIIRCMRGKYERPYAEYKQIQFDFQILVLTSKKNIRPTIPPNCPEGFVNLINQCWELDPEKRPTCPEILEQLQSLERSYLENKKRWDKVRDKPKKV
ncbi:hypothetical protein SAMD00019534_094940 [Acytostelium subglobosum LB1]|uniref:hypothetical protein n=1 Tax=Acytostelium subglobosum LB1 TaxID=1410327 RepID=UPI000645193D|nr:hypothetical protein SAMD00019534_094940 [Acytostelium subglobosum LB1]GAM26319.1 hypothetical protein SAMD00019534_094940 [Acytostelium subglobosum LB1]|eukprot:XP_012750873.1 hypothetical protein SAMD00019534_094940 [Acytostelium subglobosum LB1]